ncbi:MAG: hypothetical protein DPW16_11760 [Chloroflexi bacterium]|nr:hypothetical protein [Chloroflexota bacterium]
METPYFQLHRHTLANGMRVWCIPRPNTGTVAMMAQLPVGSRTENKHNNGISHFLEHMVFTGTERWAESEVTDVVRRRGGEVNAHTSRESTNFHIHVAAQDAAFGLDWLYQLVFKPTLLPEKFEKERQVIINEKGGEFDLLQTVWEWIEDHNWGWHVARAIRRRIYPDSSLLLSIIGRDKTLNAITHQELVDYYRRYYVPNNVTLIVVGDIEPQAAFDLAQKTFGDIPARPFPPTHPRVRVVPNSFDVRLHGPSPNEQGQLLIGVLLDYAEHPDRFGWWIIEEILENACMRDIRFELGLTYGVNVFTVLYTDTGYFCVYTSANIEDFERIRQIIEKHLDRLVHGDFTTEELAEAQASLRGRALLNLQDNMELAWWLSTDALATRNDSTPIPDYFAEISRLTPDEVKRIAGQYFAPQKRFYVEHRPVVTPRRLKPLAAVAAFGMLSAAVRLSFRPRHRAR